MELTKINNDLEKSIKEYLSQDELQFKFYCPEKYEITNEEMIRDGQKNIKIAISERERILAKTKEIKLVLDGLKKPVLEYEKQIEKAAADAKGFFETAEQVYKTKKAEEQRKINDAINKIHALKSQAIQSIVNFNLLANSNIDRLKLQVDKWEIENADVPIEETESALEQIKEIEEEIRTEIVPIEIVHEAKNFVQERLIEDKEEYSISNEQAFINYAFKNNRQDLLICKPALAAFKQWVKLDGNKKESFVRITIKKK